MNGCGKASVNDLMAALGSVGPWMLLEDLASWTSFVDWHVDFL